MIIIITIRANLIPLNFAALNKIYFQKIVNTEFSELGLIYFQSEFNIIFYLCSSPVNNTYYERDRYCKMYCSYNKLTHELRGAQVGTRWQRSRRMRMITTQL